MIQASRRTFLVSALGAMLPVAHASSQTTTGLVRFGVTVADNVVYAPAFAAAELGFFEAAGVKASVVPLRGAAAGEEALAAGHVDLIDHVIAYTSRAVSSGVDARVIATASNGFLGWSVIVRTDSPITSLRDLVGKRVGIGPRLSVSDMAAQRLADQLSARFDLTHLSPGLLMPALRNGEVEAVLFSAAVAQREVVAGNARTLHDLTDPADRTAVYGYAASTDAMERRGEDLRRFLAAVMRATTHMQRDEAWSLRFLKAYVKIPDDRLARILHERVIAHLSPDGETEPDAVERAVALAARAWNAPAMVETPVGAMFTNAFLREGA